MSIDRDADVLEYGRLDSLIKRLEDQIVREKNARVSKQAKERNVEQLQNRVNKLIVQKAEIENILNSHE